MSEEETRPRLPRLGREMLAQLVDEIYRGDVFTSANIPRSQFPQALPMVFLPLAFGNPWVDFDPKSFGVFYGNLRDAFPRSINGLPCLSSVGVMCIEDWEEVFAEIGRRQERDRMERESFAARFTPTEGRKVIE